MNEVTSSASTGSLSDVVTAINNAATDFASVKTAVIGILVAFATFKIAKWVIKKVNL